MPELPEVEVTRQGVAPALEGRPVTGVRLRAPRLRYPMPTGLADRLRGAVLRAVERRAKYLLFRFDEGTLLVHLGMSGSLRVLPRGARPRKHDHADLCFGECLLRLHDPRRFGALVWIEGDPERHPLLARLGVEPLSRAFSAQTLRGALGRRRTPIKVALMDSHIVVGVGNIYASESLFRAGIDPRRAAGSLSAEEATRLVAAIKHTLRAAIRAGGSTLQDFVGADGQAGYFQQRYRVYGRAGEPCRQCGRPVQSLRQSNRATFYCAHCQR